MLKEEMTEIPVFIPPKSFIGNESENSFTSVTKQNTG